jgi:SAM-dependent methyltransferase
MMDSSDGVDRSGGWDAVSTDFLRARSTIGAGTVRRWASTLPSGASVLDLGCGDGVPITQALVNAGCAVYGIDASPTMVAAFRRNFPTLPVACEAVEESPFFGRTFDAAVAWGLLFLLAEEVQHTVIHRVASVLGEGGRFLFTAPRQRCSWTDASTGRASQSLGDEAYRTMLAAAGLFLIREHEDEGGNHYHEAVRDPRGAT